MPRFHGEALRQRNAEVIVLVRAGAKHAEVAARFGVTVFTINKIVSAYNATAQGGATRRRRRPVRLPVSPRTAPTTIDWRPVWEALRLPVRADWGREEA